MHGARKASDVSTHNHSYCSPQLRAKFCWYCVWKQFDLGGRLSSRPWAGNYSWGSTKGTDQPEIVFYKGKGIRMKKGKGYLSPFWSLLQVFCAAVGSVCSPVCRFVTISEIKQLFCDNLKMLCVSFRSLWVQHLVRVRQRSLSGFKLQLYSCKSWSQQH